MTMKELSQLSALESEIRLLRRQIAESREDRKNCAVVDVVLSSSKHPPYQQHAQVVGGYGPSGQAASLSRLIGERRARLGAALIEREQERIRLEDYIASIPDSLTRQIFRLRFVEGMEWRDVAAKVGGDNSADGVRMIVMCYNLNWR